jgi:hypothetical protein
MVLQLRHLGTGAVIRSYETEDPALAFVRDVVRFGSRQEAAQFALVRVAEQGHASTIAEGEALVKRALEDQGGTA